MDNEGEWEPTFTNPKQRRYLISDEEYKNSFTSSKEYIDMYDPLRGWYFFTKEEQQKTISDIRAGIPFLEETIDSTKQTAWQRNLESWRKALDIAQSDKWEPVSNWCRHQLLHRGFFVPRAAQLGR